MMTTTQCAIMVCLGFLSLGLNPRDTAKTVLVLGDSLSAGYQIGLDQAYPALLQEKADRADLEFKIVNAGLSGDTTAGGFRRIDWLLRGRIEVLILELGANDGLRGISPESTKANLQGIINKTRDHFPHVEIIIAGMMVPPNLGPAYTEDFRRIFSELASANGAHLIPFLLKDVAGKRELNLSDGIHPNSRGHQIVADTVWEILEPVLVSIAQ